MVSCIHYISCIHGYLVSIVSYRSISWYLVFMVSCIHCILYPWYLVSMVSYIHDIFYPWYLISMLPWIHYTYISYLLYLVSMVYLYVRYFIFMISCIHGIVHLWYFVSMVSCIILYCIFRELLDSVCSNVFCINFLQILFWIFERILMFIPLCAFVTLVSFIFYFWILWKLWVFVALNLSNSLLNLLTDVMHNATNTFSLAISLSSSLDLSFR